MKELGITMKDLILPNANQIPVLPVTRWYNSQSEGYNYKNPPLDDINQPFYQTVWKKTTHMGCGFSISANLIQCFYDTRVVLDKIEVLQNVPPLIDVNVAENMS